MAESKLAGGVKPDGARAAQTTRQGNSPLAGLRPLIPERYLSVPDQRFYALAIFGGLQAYKLSDSLFYLFRSTLGSTSASAAGLVNAGAGSAAHSFLSPSWILSSVPVLGRIFDPSASQLPIQPHASATDFVTKWLLLDALVLVALKSARIPGLRFGWLKWLIYLSILYLMNGLAFGKFEIFNSLSQFAALTVSILTGTRGKVLDLSSKSIRRVDVLHQEEHLLGAMVIKVLPHGNAVLNPLGATYCIPPNSGASVYIPLILNNSEPYEIVYAITSPDHAEPQQRTLAGSSLKRYTKRLEAPANGWEDDEEEDERESRDGQPWFQTSEESDTQSASSNPLDPTTGTMVLRRASVRPDDIASALPRHIEPSQKIFYLPVNQLGSVKLVSIKDEDGSFFRIRQDQGHGSAETFVVECPGTSATPSPVLSLSNSQEDNGEQTQYRCVGDKDDLQTLVRGVGSLAVGWKISERDNPRSTQHNLISGIEGKSSTPEALDSSLQLVPYNPSTLPFQANTHVAGFTINHDRPGIFDVEILNVTDSLLNHYVPTPGSLKRSFEVLKRPSASFGVECSNVEPRRLLQGQKVDLGIFIHEQDRRSPKVLLQVSYQPDSDASEPAWERDIEVQSQRHTLSVNQPGTYRIRSIVGRGAKNCPGSILEPSTCIVRAIPTPLADVHMESVKGCAGDVGVNANVKLRGTPPFVLHYTQQQKGGQIQKLRTETIASPDYLLYLEPPAPGEWTWKFDAVQDANYQRIPLNVAPFHQTMHPLASLALISTGRSQDIWTCSTNTTSLQVRVAGTPPFDVDYTIGWSTGSESLRQTFRSQGEHKINVEVPEALRQATTGSNAFSVSFNKIVDGNNCTRHLQTDARSTKLGTTFVVKTTTPTARFDLRERDRDIALIEGQTKRIPVRLTGERPWEILLKHMDESGKITESKYKFATANEELEVKKKGVYKLEGVKDSHCSGRVLEGQDEIRVTFIGRPEISLVDPISLDKKAQGRRESICAGDEDRLLLKLSGRGPFDFRYRHHHTDLTNTRHTKVEKLRSAQSVGVLHMVSAPGHHVYEILGVGDAAYPLADVSSSKQTLFSITQEVKQRPSARFTRKPTLSFCQGASLSPSSSDRPRVEFRGEPPFSASFQLREPGSRGVTWLNVSDIKSTSWGLDFPDHHLQRVGPHYVSLYEMADGSSCPYQPADEEDLHFAFDVVEPASIVATERQTDYCVGDTLDFVLQGAPPWTVTYKWNGKTYHALSDTAAFSRIAERPGKFEVTSVAHKKNQCQKDVNDIARTIHPLPSAKVEEGMASLHEGDQATIVFSFVGEPPFTFTYTRSLPEGNKKTMKVVETQTFAGIQENTFQIYSSLEGEYRVTYIADAHCSYPPLSSTAGGSNARAAIAGSPQPKLLKAE